MKLIQIHFGVTSKATEHFQAPVGVIIFESIQIENTLTE